MFALMLTALDFACCESVTRHAAAWLQNDGASDAGTSDQGDGDGKSISMLSSSMVDDGREEVSSRIT